jgi:hypothetical protein
VLHFPVILTLLAILLLVALFVIALIAIRFQQHFDQPVIAIGEHRRLQWPLWIWIPVIVVVGFEGWRIRTGDLHRRLAEAEFHPNVYEVTLQAWLEDTRLGRPTSATIHPAVQYELIAELPAALADESEPVQKLAIQICGQKFNHEWMASYGSPSLWFATCSADDKAKLLQALRAYEENPGRPADLRAEAKAAADWLATEIRP